MDNGMKYETGLTTVGISSMPVNLKQRIEKDGRNLNRSFSQQVIQILEEYYQIKKNNDLHESVKDMKKGD